MASVPLIHVFCFRFLLSVYSYFRLYLWYHILGLLSICMLDFLTGYPQSIIRNLFRKDYPVIIEIYEIYGINCLLEMRSDLSCSIYQYKQIKLVSQINVL